MQSEQEGKPETLRRYLADRKLNTSAKMLAVLGFFCDLQLTDPVIESLSMTEEGDVLARAKDRSGLFFISSHMELRHSLMGVCDALEIPAGESRMLAIEADRILAESRRAANRPGPLTAYAIGCSIWSHKEEPIRDSVRFCCRRKR